MVVKICRAYSTTLSYSIKLDLRWLHFAQNEIDFSLLEFDRVEVEISLDWIVLGLDCSRIGCSRIE